MIIYRIRRKSDGKWSRGGWGPVSELSENYGWTDSIRRAKTWKRRSDLNSHLTSIRQHCERYPQRNRFPIDWEVVAFQITETETEATPLDHLLRYEG